MLRGVFQAPRVSDYSPWRVPSSNTNTQDELPIDCLANVIVFLLSSVARALILSSPRQSIQFGTQVVCGPQGGLASMYPCCPSMENYGLNISQLCDTAAPTPVKGAFCASPRLPSASPPSPRTAVGTRYLLVATNFTRV